MTTSALHLRETFLTVKELSERYQGKIAVRTLNNWRQRGSGPPFQKTGGTILYPLSKLIAWEESRIVNSTSQYKR